MISRSESPDFLSILLNFDELFSVAYFDLTLDLRPFFFQFLGKSGILNSLISAVLDGAYFFVGVIKRPKSNSLANLILDDFLVESEALRISFVDSPKSRLGGVFFVLFFGLAFTDLLLLISLLTGLVFVLFKSRSFFFDTDFIPFDIFC